MPGAAVGIGAAAELTAEDARMLTVPGAIVAIVQVRCRFRVPGSCLLKIDAIPIQVGIAGSSAAEIGEKAEAVDAVKVGIDMRLVSSATTLQGNISGSFGDCVRNIHEFHRAAGCHFGVGRWDWEVSLDQNEIGKKDITGKAGGAQSQDQGPDGGRERGLHFRVLGLINRN